MAEGKPYLGLSDDQYFAITDGGDTLLVQDEELGLCRVDMTLPPSQQVLIPAPNTVVLTHDVIEHMRQATLSMLEERNKG